MTTIDLLTLLLAGLHPSIHYCTSQVGFSLGIVGKMCRWVGFLTLSSVWILLVLGLCLCGTLPSTVKFAVLVGVVLCCNRAILFPLHALSESLRCTADTPSAERASRFRRCFELYFRLHHNLDTLRTRPHIIVTNYPNDRAESLALWMLPCTFALVVKSSVNKNLKLHKRIHCVIVPEGGNAFDATRDAVREALQKGHHVVVYLNNPSPIHSHHYDRYRTGILRIAQELSIPVTPMAIDQFETRWGLLPEQSFQLRLGKPFYITDVARDLCALQTFFSTMVKRFQRLKTQIDF